MHKIILIPNKYLLLIDENAKTEVKDGGWCLEIHDEYASDKIRVADIENNKKSWYLRELNMAYLKETPKEFTFHRKIDGSVKAILAHLPLKNYPLLDGVELLPDFYKPTFSSVPGFVSFEQAEELKTLGYNEPSIAYYTHNGRFSRCGSLNTTVDFDLYTLKELYHTYSLAPMISEVFKWFHKKGYFEHTTNVTHLTLKEYWAIYIKFCSPEEFRHFRGEHLFESEELATAICLNKMIELLKKGFPPVEEGEDS